MICVARYPGLNRTRREIRMSSAAVKTCYSPEEYLALERKATVKHEYHGGSIFAMSGASREHNLISLNLASEIRSQLRDRPCEVYAVDMRVCVRSTGLYTYPDVVAFCGDPQFLDSEVDTLLNPTLLVEVLSPSTEAYDRGRKFAHYRRLDCLREYVLVAQERMLVERYTRQEEGWNLTEMSGHEDVLRLSSIGCEVPLREIYARVAFPAEGDA
jgi:Uma2 family endonuclease